MLSNSAVGKPGSNGEQKSAPSEDEQQIFSLFMKGLAHMMGIAPPLVVKTEFSKDETNSLTVDLQKILVDENFPEDKREGFIKEIINNLNVGLKIINSLTPDDVENEEKIISLSTRIDQITFEKLLEQNGYKKDSLELKKLKAKFVKLPVINAFITYLIDKTFEVASQIAHASQQVEQRQQEEQQAMEMFLSMFNAAQKPAAGQEQQVAGDPMHGISLDDESLAALLGADGIGIFRSMSATPVSPRSAREPNSPLAIESLPKAEDQDKTQDADKNKSLGR